MGKKAWPGSRPSRRDEVVVNKTPIQRAASVGVTLMFCLAVACSSDDNPTAPSSVSFTITDLVVGTGPTASTGQTLSVAYTGWLYDANAVDNKGTVFDQTTAAAPFSFVLGAGQVIAGWEQGFAGMQVGGRRRLLIPPELAYGSQGAGTVIPPNATLIFEVELLALN